MKIFVCVLLFFISVNAQKQRPELVSLRDDYIKGTKDYKASLERLLAIYESNVKKADENLANAKKLFDEGLIGRSQVEDDERLVRSAQEKVSETRKQIANADSQIADAQIGNVGSLTAAELAKEAELAQEYKKTVNAVMTLVAQNTQDQNTPTPPAQVGFNEPSFTKQCKLAPNIRGIGLRMPLAEFKHLYPQSSAIKSGNEVGEVSVSLRDLQDRRLKGIGSLSASFIDGQLYYLNVRYDDQIEWSGIDQFVATFSEATGVPQGWVGRDNERLLPCASFYLYAELLYARNPKIVMFDRIGLQEHEKRQGELRKRQEQLKEEYVKRQEEERRRQEQLKSPANFKP